MEMVGQPLAPAGLNSGENPSTCGKWSQSKRGCVWREDSLAIIRNRTWFLDHPGRILDTRIYSVSDTPLWRIFY